MASIRLEEALEALDQPTDRGPRWPIMHGKAGTLLAFDVPVDGGKVRWTGLWVTPTSIQFLDVDPPEPHGSRAHRIEGNAAGLFDRYILAMHEYLELISELDEEIADIQGRGPSVPLAAIWPFKQRASRLRAGLARAMSVSAECSTLFEERLPGWKKVFPSIEAELVRLQQMVAAVEQSVSDLILLRNAEESNRIANAANDLSRTSNRIAALANISNIRMLGITFLALFLALISAVILFPNTGATILGMPSAAWVPGIWVDVSLALLAIVPLVWVLSRPWVRRMLKDVHDYESRIEEGLADLPELKPGAGRAGSAIETRSPP
jgi:hypothetical protein